MQGMFSLAVEPHFIKIYFLPTPLVERLQMDFFFLLLLFSILPTLRYKDYIYVFILGTENAMCVCGGGGRVGVGAWFLR